MNRIHIVGGKNHGKTTLVCELIAELKGRGLRVGSIKHTHHHHELDTPGKDSHRHRESGADLVGILSPTQSAVFWPGAPNDGRASAAGEEERYTAFEPLFRECDIVLVEGDTRTSAHKLEVWRAVCGTPPLAQHLTNVLAIVSDDAVDCDVLLLAHRQLPVLADFVCSTLRVPPPRRSDPHGTIGQSSVPVSEYEARLGNDPGDEPEMLRDRQLTPGLDVLIEDHHALGLGGDAENAAGAMD